MRVRAVRRKHAHRPTLFPASRSAKPCATRSWGESLDAVLSSFVNRQAVRSVVVGFALKGGLPPCCFVFCVEVSSRKKFQKFRRFFKFFFFFGPVTSIASPLPDGSCAATNTCRLRTRSLLPARIHGRTSHVHPFSARTGFRQGLQIKSNCSAVSAMLQDDKAPDIRRVALLIPVSVPQAHAWCSLRRSVGALLGTCACPTDT